MPKLTEEEAQEIEEGIPNLRGPSLITWIRKLLDDRRERIEEDRSAARVSPKNAGRHGPKAP